ncbi:MAG: hypothetical protein ACRETW_15330 [Stenotrophobium sp.]
MKFWEQNEPRLEGYARAMEELIEEQREWFDRKRQELLMRFKDSADHIGGALDLQWRKK